jgi:tight adherence protein B
MTDLPLVLQGVGIAVLFGRLFYDSWPAVIIMSPTALIWFVIQKKREREKMCRTAGIQFRDAIFSVLTNLKAGYSIENAFMDSERDMETLYGKKSIICRQINKLNKGLKNNIPLEKLIFTMGNECGNKDIQEFALVFNVAKRSGGNMTEIIERTINVISQKINTEKEIDVLISAKRLESRIMNCVPFFIIFYISLTSPGFFGVLYHNPIGYGVMTVCTAIYIISFLLSEKIVNIKV